MNEHPNTTGILNYAKLKRQTAVQKVDEAIKLLIKQQGQINFNSVATEAGVSKSYLYNNLEIRQRIDRLRKQQEGVPTSKQVKRKMSDESKDVIIASLRKRVQELEKQVEMLKTQVNVDLSDFYKHI